MDVILEEGANFIPFGDDPTIVYLEDGSVYNPALRIKSKVKLTWAQKMAHRPGVSLPIKQTCLPSSANAKDPRLVCTHCYGKTGRTTMPNAKKAYKHNLNIYREDPDDFFADLDRTLSWIEPNFFRHFVIGDLSYFSALVLMFCF